MEYGKQKNLKIRIFYIRFQKKKEKVFCHFRGGVWVTAYARRNLIENIMALDDFMIYADTDSIKLMQGYNKNVIENYNKKVITKLEKVAKDLKIPFKKFAPKDINGIEHCLGLFEKEYTSKENHEFTYKEFKTEGAKKYAYRTMGDKIKITVSGVPKKRSSSVKKQYK